jgi:hypothetical protein
MMIEIYKKCSGGFLSLFILPEKFAEGGSEENPREDGEEKTVR